MLSVQTTSKAQQRPKGYMEIWGGAGYAYYFVHSDGIMSVCIWPNSSNCRH